MNQLKIGLQSKLTFCPNTKNYVWLIDIIEIKHWQSGLGDFMGWLRFKNRQAYEGVFVDLKRLKN